MSSRRGLLAGVVWACAVALPLTVSKTASAVIIERVVAVVGERPILLTELQHRAIPFLYRIYAQTKDPAQIAAHESGMYKELLDKMVNDRLEEHAAERSHLNVSADELDNAIKNVAKMNNLSPSALIAEAARSGLSEQDYRDELRRQLLEGKLLQLHVRSRVRVTEQDAKAEYEAWLKQNGAQAQAEVRILAMRIPPGSSEEVEKARILLAQNLVARARSGEDFCAMVAQYSDDQATRTTCGSRGLIPVDGLVKDVQDVIAKLKPGEYSDPFFIGMQGDEAILVVQLVTAPTIPTFDKVKDEMLERAFSEAMDRQRKLWLDELRRGVYIDVRM
jgi:peptidyl-prolyl cis-trans isomerase SurA